MCLEGTELILNCIDLMQNAVVSSLNLLLQRLYTNTIPEHLNYEYIMKSLHDIFDFYEGYKSFMYVYIIYLCNVFLFIK